MREILFRGQTRRKGEKVTIGGVPVPSNWVYGGVAQTMPDKDFSIIYQVEPEIHKYPVYADTIGQYIGLKDRNGNKIFEGDIFKFEDEIWELYDTSCGTEYNSWEVENYAVVGYNEETARFDFVKYKFNNNSVEADLHENHDLEFADFVSELEIIGNIYDNPELLEETK